MHDVFEEFLGSYKETIYVRACVCACVRALLACVTCVRGMRACVRESSVACVQACVRANVHARMLAFIFPC